MKKRKLRKKVLGLLVGLLALSEVIVSINHKASTETFPHTADATYPHVEIASISENGWTIDYPIFHVSEIDQAIQAYMMELLSQTDGDQHVLTYTIPHYSQQTVAVQFTETNGENVMIDTLNIDVTDGSVLQLEDLIQKESLNEFENLLTNIACAEIEEFNQSTCQDFILYNHSIMFHWVDEGGNNAQLAVSKSLFDGMLKESYQAGERNADIAGNQEPTNVIVKRPATRIDALLDKKVIAMTFDDGPKRGTTDVILDALKKYDAHATFFVLGSMAEKSPDLLHRMVEEGQEIGSHTYNHPQLTKITNQEIIAQLSQTNKVLEQATGTEPTAFRPPYGAIDDRVRSCLGNNTEVALWDIDTEDWKYRNSEHITQAVLNNAADGKIILMHDIYKTSAEAVVAIIEELSAQGYEIVSFSELQEIKKRRMLVK